MRKIINYLSGVLFMLLIMVVPVSAAEYSVTEVNAVLYTNSDTMVYADADEQAMLLPNVEEGLPIMVTGITDNGYFRIDLGGQTFYIQANGLSQPESAASAASDTSGTNIASAGDIYGNVYNILIAQKAVFPEGMRWTNDNFVSWRGGIYSGGFGCAGFAFALSDAAFGDAPAMVHSDFANIRVGDIIRMDNDTHSVILLEVKADSVIVAEGNYNSSVHWGRTIPRAKLQEAGNYVMTRYR